jgi:mono/diheme cytochrome c family protein
MHSISRRSVTALASLALLLAAVFTVSACSNATNAGTWVQPNQNPQNTRYAGGRIHQSTINNLGVGWTADQRTKAGFGSLAPSPLITKNNVFIQAPAGNLVAFNLTTGELTAGTQSPKIATRLPSWLLTGGKGRLRTLRSAISPILTTGDDDARIAVGAAGNRVVALNSSDGSKAWSTTIDSISGTNSLIISNMAAAHGKIYVPVANIPKDIQTGDLAATIEALKKEDTQSGSLVAIDASSGKVAWTKKLASVPLGAATVVNDVLFTSTLDGNVYGFDPSNGDQLWTSPLPAGAVAPIAAFSGTLIVPAGYVFKRGQKAQVVAFTIGGLGSIGGAAAPKIAAQKEDTVAGEAEGSKLEDAAASGPDGKELFTQNCAGCHALKAAGTSGTSGPNLDDLKPSAAVVDKQVTKGGTAMPAFKGTLSAAEIKAIADYVASVAGK